MSISLLVASTEEHFRESIQESAVSAGNVRVIANYPEVSSNLYIRVLQDLERNHDAALIVDLVADPENALKSLEKIKQAVPDIYVIASNYHADAETVIASVRAGANDFLMQPLKRNDFRDVIARLERAPKRTSHVASRLGRIYSFLGVKGGVGTTTLAVNFAAVLAQRKHQTVLLDLDFTGNECSMQLGVTPAHTIEEVGENLSRLDQSLFEGLMTRDPLGFFLVSPLDQVEHRPQFTEPMFRELADFLVERYEAVVVDAGRSLTDEVALASLFSSHAVFLIMNQRFPSVRNAQRYIAGLMRLGFNQDQIRVVVNQYQKKPDANLATLDQIKQTLNLPVFYGVPPSPAVVSAVHRGRPVVAERASAPDWDKSMRAFVDKAAGAAQPTALPSRDGVPSGPGAVSIRG